MNKISTQKVSSTKGNLHATRSMKKISFTSRKINLGVSRREKSTCNNFANKNQRTTSSMSKIFTRRKINVQVSLREKAACNMFNEPKSACNKFH